MSIRSKSFSRFLRERSEVRVTTSLMPAGYVSGANTVGHWVEEHTWILSILWTNILVTGVQYILIHQCRPRRHLPEEAHLDRLADLDPLALLHEDLPRVFASILAV